jgi:hypothetical protein
MRIWFAGLSIKRYFGGTHAPSVLGLWSSEVRRPPGILVVRHHAEMAARRHLTMAKRLEYQQLSTKLTGSCRPTLAGDG